MEIPKCQKDTDLRGEDLKAKGQLVILYLRSLPGPLGGKGSVNNNQPLEATPTVNLPILTGSTAGLSLHTHLQVGTTEVF